MEINYLFELALYTVLFLYSVVILLFTSALFFHLFFSSKRQYSIVIQGDKKRDLRVSVILPVCNEAVHILSCLEGLNRQDYPHHLMEIIVTDDFSEDHTVEIVQRYANEHPSLHILLIKPDPCLVGARGKKAAIARAIERAGGEVIIATDADTSRESRWVSLLVEKFLSGNYMMVIAPVAFKNERTLFERIQSLEFLGLMGTTLGSAALGYPVMCNGANVAYAKRAYGAVGGFSGNLKFSSGDDQFMMTNIGRMFGRKSIAPIMSVDSFVYTDPLSSMGAFINQRLRWVSKSRGYRDTVVIFVAIITYAVHLLLFWGLIIGIWHLDILLFSVVALLVKMVVDYPMVWIMARLLKKKRLLVLFFIAQIFQLVYVTVIGFSGQFIPYRWKGRRGV